jgi:glutathione synthase/RimK-type ligase-like ATP-grasp enzyme
MTLRHQPDDQPKHETEAIRRLVELARARGWRIDVEPATRFAVRVTLPSGARHLVIGADLGLNSSSGARVAHDKGFAHHFLALDRLPCVPTFPVADAAEVLGTVAEHGLAYPLVIKPNRSLEARGLSIVHAATEIAAALDRARALDPIVLLQPFDPRPEFRLLVLDGALLAAFEKHRPNPTAPANLAAGATWTDRTDAVHASHLDLARRAACALALRLAAVDVFARDIGVADPAAAILEVNATPGFKALASRPAALDRLFDALARTLSGLPPPAVTPAHP